jgi:hypothetical protein
MYKSPETIPLIGNTVQGLAVFANSKKFQYFPTGQNVVREEKLPN